MINALFVAGTDTDVGKTVASKALLQAFAAKNLITAGFKPVASGSDCTEEGLRNSDALHLQGAATKQIPYDDVNPYAFALPVSPHIAAKYEDIEIQFEKLSDKFHQLKKLADVVLVEGTGGWRVPVSETRYLSDWVKQEALAVVLVVGIKHGCLSHALLTAEAIRHDGLKLVGWIANRINPGTEHYSDIISMLELKLPAPKLGEIPYVPSAKRRELNKYITIEPLLS